jgi:hypothetical protein
MKLITFALLFIFLGSQIARGEHNFGTYDQALGGATRALGQRNGALFFNPALILRERRISPEVDYFFVGEEKSHRVTASVVDSKTAAWGLGLAYSGNFLANQRLPSAHLFHFTTAMPIVSDAFCLGSSLSYVYDPKPRPGDYRHFFNFDLGFMANLSFGLSLAVVADHLLAPKGDEKGLGIGLGLGFDFSKLSAMLPLSFSFDWLMDDVSSSKDLGHSIGTGLQYVILTLIPLRLGYHRNFALNEHLLSVGSGISYKVFVLDLLYQQNLHVGRSRNFGVLVGLNF